MNERPAFAALLAQLHDLRDGARLRELLQEPTLTGAGVRVALFDTGIDADFLKMRAKERGQPEPKVRTSAWPRGAGEPQPCAGLPSAAHGTTVADILFTFAPGIELRSIDVFGPRGQAEVETLAAALHWAAASGIQVVNLSLGVAEANLQPLARRQLLWRAVEEAYHHDVLVVAAAHNDHPQTRGYPALFAPPLVSVTKATDAPSLGIEYLANDRIEFAAHSQGYCGPFCTEPASSWAAPHAAALAAKLLELEPSLKPFELKTLLYWAAAKDERR